MIIPYSTEKFFFLPNFRNIYYKVDTKSKNFFTQKHIIIVREKKDIVIV